MIVDFKELDASKASEAVQVHCSVGSGVKIVSIPYSEEGVRVIRSGYGDLIKWSQEAHPEIQISADDGEASRLIEQAGELWLPLVVLAQDVTIQVYLGLVVDYVKDKIRGLLSDEHPIVKFKVLKKDDDGALKELSYEGPPDELKQLMKKFDGNKFFE